MHRISIYEYNYIQCYSVLIPPFENDVSRNIFVSDKIASTESITYMLWCFSNNRGVFLCLGFSIATIQNK